MDTLEDLMMTRPPTAQRPLLGLTVLAVEDSRYACEAMRLLCQRSGARIRRADSLHHARRHLRTYRPNALIVDLGLPDGSGVELIGEVGTVSVRPDVVLGTSGDPGAADRALAAGADGFLAKPIDSLAQFQSTILSFLPRDRQPNGPRSLTAETVDPDPIALRDDLGHAAALLETGAEAEVDYVVQFLGGVARSAGDDNLDAAIGALALARSSGRAHAGEVKALRRAITDRIEKVSPF